jgi:hypothetical protein
METPDAGGSPEAGGGASQETGTGEPSPSCPCTREGGDTKVHQDLACLCRRPGPFASLCSTTLQNHRVGTCPPSFFVLRTTGCGKVTYRETNISARSLTFDLATGSLVGVVEGGDVVWGECSVHAYAYGDNNESCPTVEQCKVCGGTDADACP